MARVGTYIIHTQEPGKPKQTYLFYTLASSESQALKIFRVDHKRWKVVGIQAPMFPTEPPPPRPSRPKGRKRQ
jgi:hypothetical protein